MTEQTLAGQSPDSTYGEAQHPTFKKERRGKASYHPIYLPRLVLPVDWVLLSSWRGSYHCGTDNLQEVITILGPCGAVPVGFNC